MRRQLNFRLLLTTFAVLVGLGAAFHGLHVWQVDRNVASLLAYAREAKKEKKIDQALSLYDQYLKLKPKDLDVQEEFALELDAVSQSLQDRNRVVTLFERLLLKSSERKAARARLIENLILLGRYEAAARHLEILRPLWPDGAEIEHKRGWCLDADKKYDAAAVAYQKAVDLDPKRIQSSLLLAEVLHHRLARDVEAQQILDKMVAANPTSATAFLARFRYQRMLGRDAEAAKDLAEARRLASEDADVILAACQWARAKGQDAEARELVAKGTKLFPANEGMIMEHARLELRQGRRDLALQVIEDGLKALGSKTRSGELQVFHADLLIDANKTKEAAAIVAALRQEGLAPALPDFLQARLLVQERKWSQAQALLEKTRIALAADAYWNSRVNALLGVCFAQLGDGDRQIAALLDAARSEPRWAALNLSLGQAYLDADNPEQALLYLRPLLDDPEAPRGAHTLFAQVRYRLAMQLPEKQRPWKEIETAVAQADKRDPGSLDVALLRSDILQAQHKVDAARSLLLLETKKRSIETLPDDLAAWLALADLETRSGDYERADDILQETQKRFGDRVGVRLGKARILVQRGRSDDRTALKTVAENAESLSPEDRGRLRRELAEMWLRQGDNVTARDLLVRAAADVPRDFRSRALLLDLDLQDSKLDDARTWLKEMQEIEGPSGKHAAFAALYVRVEEAFGQSDALRKLLAELKNSPLRRGDGRIELVEARIYERLGESERTLTKLLEAVVAGQRSPRVLQRLIQLLTERQEYERLPWAISLLEGRGPLPREVGRASIEAALATKRIDQARDLLGPIDIETIRDYRELLWLGRIYKAMNDSALVDRSLRRAVAVAPHAPDAWVALANFLLAAGKRPQANDLVADIDRKAPEKSRPVIRARVLQALGNVKGADAAHRAALKSRPSDFLVLLAAADFYRQTDQPLLAEPLYKKILDLPALATPPEIAARARRGLALSVSSAAPVKAAEILTANRARQELLDDRLAIYLSGLDPARRVGAIRDFEATLPRGPASPDEIYWLAQLLDAADRSDAVAARLAPLIAEDKDTPQMLAFYVRSLMRQGKIDEARPLVNRLLDREPDSPRSRELQEKLADPKSK